MTYRLLCGALNSMLILLYSQEVALPVPLKLRRYIRRKPRRYANCNACLSFFFRVSILILSKLI